MSATTEPRGGRTPAEWTTFLVSSVVLAIVVVLIVGQMLSTTDAAAPRAEVGAIERIGNRYRAHVLVTNDGDKTAANVQVSAELTGGARTESGDLTIDFLAGGEDQDLVFLFDENPAAGELRVVVSGYQTP